MLKNKQLFVASLLILLPLIDSLFVPTAFGLQYHSEKSMYLVSAYFMPLKLLFVVVGFLLLTRHVKVKIEHGVVHRWYAKAYSIALLILATGQGALYLIICTLYLIVGSQAQDYQQQGHISVYTSDVGAFGKATHYFSYQCTDAAGFYTLTPIVTLDWLGHFSFIEKDNTLIINHNDYAGKGEQTKRIDISAFSCNKKALNP